MMSLALDINCNLFTIVWPARRKQNNALLMNHLGFDGCFCAHGQHTDRRTGFIHILILIISLGESRFV